MNSNSENLERQQDVDMEPEDTKKKTEQELFKKQDNITTEYSLQFTRDVIRKYVLTNFVQRIEWLLLVSVFIQGYQQINEKDAFKQAYTQIIQNRQQIELCLDYEEEPMTLQQEEFDNYEGDFEKFKYRAGELFKSGVTLAFSFMKNPQQMLDPTKLNLDFERMNKFNAFVEQYMQEDFEAMVSQLCDHILDFIKHHENNSLSSLVPYFIRAIYIVCQNSFLLDFQAHGVLEKIIKTVNKIICLETNFHIAVSILSELTKDQIKKEMNIFQTLMAIQLYQHSYDSKTIRHSIHLLDIYYHVNKNKPRDQKIKDEDFYNGAINELIDFKKDFINWHEFVLENSYEKAYSDRRKFFSMCSFPWILDASSKTRILNFESIIQQQKEIDKALLQNFNNFFQMGQDNSANDPFLTIVIKRESLMEEALNQLVNAGDKLKKPLKVKFVGEPAQDEGGVQKEFFQLLVREIFDPQYSMFNLNSDSHLYWFNGQTVASNIQFELVGIIMGLAIYNNILLDIHMPNVCFKKLLDYQPNIEDLKELDFELGSSLEYILNYDNDDLENALYVTFVMETEFFGEAQVTFLKPNGDQIFVNQENKHEYVNLVIDFLFNRQCDKQFKSFYNGFHKVIKGHITKLFTPDEMQQIICGNPILDFSELKKVTHYMDGYEPESPQMEWLWEILEEFNYDEKKRFLFFCTGCAKAPCNGLKGLKFYISRHGEDSERMPCAHTCFNHLLIPEYESKDKLRQKLLAAIDNSEGFGLI